MKTLLRAGIPALCALCAPQAALADDASGDTETPAIVVESDLLHPSAGLMNDHMHDGGEVMIGLRWDHRHSSGANRSGTDAIADADIVAAGYSARATAMDMDMAMLDIMYAPSDTITLMVMPHYMWHRMTMVGIDPMAGMDDGMDMGGDMGGGHAGHHMLAYGQTMTHSSEGFGDTLVSASYRLVRSEAFNAHATLGVWVPTGSTDKTNADGTFVHYGMQPGGGTWDIEPSITLSGRSGALGWGAQGSYRYKTEDANGSGFAFGDQGKLTGWLSYAPSAAVGLTGRLAYEHEGKVQGHYNAAHNHAAPPDRQENYGGDVVRAALGLNVALPVGGMSRPQLGAEVAVPLYQDLNGIQLPEKVRFAVGLSQAF